MTELEYFNGDELAATTWRNKYAAEGEENPDDTHRRMAKEFARIEQKYPHPMSEEEIYELFKNFKYVIPGGSVMAGLGTGSLVSLSNCFVLGSPKDSYASIMKVRNQQVQLMKRRGGVGYDLSDLRPRGAKVNNAAKTSTGAASFMEVSSDITNEVAQNGRRGALMLSMDINHPDIEEFIEKKQDLSKVTGANISTKVGDEFMQAVENDKDYILRFPVDESVPQGLMIEEMPYNELWFFSDDDHSNSFFKKIKARELWNTLMHCAWNTAEPGIMFKDRMINYSPDGVYPEFRMVSTNPCGEIPMGPFDSCRLIHLNLTSYIRNPFTKDAEIDKDLLLRHSRKAMKLADDLVDLEIEAVEKIMEAVKDDEDQTEYQLWSRIRDTAVRGRRAGLGFTGLADAIAMLGVKYDSDAGLAEAREMMAVMFEGQLLENLKMARDRGSFPAWDVNLEMPEGHWSNDWYKFLDTEYNILFKSMGKYGRRNISWSTVAPTGTVSILAGTSSGIEPVFLPWYKRRRKVMGPNDRVDYTDAKGEQYTEFLVIHPGFKKWCEMHKVITDYAPEGVRRIRRADLNDEEDLKLMFKSSPYYKSTAPDIDWRKRVELQGDVQHYITHSISSTVNLDNNTTEEEIADIYLEAWRQGLKGITIYRDGCREGVLTKVEKPVTIENRQAPKRPKELEADYYQTVAEGGEQFIVLVGLLDGKPYEIFTLRPKRKVDLPNHKGVITKVGKMHYRFESKYIQLANLQKANINVEENAATLYSSMLLRHGVKIEHITKTARKVNDNITSFSSAMCRILDENYTVATEVKGEVCPSCGGRLIREGGCIHCIDCDYSKCL